MVIVAVLTPTIAVAVTVALAILVSDWMRFMLVIAVIGGLTVGLAQLMVAAQDGRVLAESDDPELFGIVDRLCVMADIPRPELVLSDQRQPNSWVMDLPRRRARLYITQGLRDLLAPEELQAVIAHELAHIANRDAVVMSVVALPTIVLQDLRGALAPAWIAGSLLQTGVFALSRYRELAADAGGAAMTGRPSALASALMTMSASLDGIPAKDLRKAAAMNAFNVVAVERKRRWWHELPLMERITATHPPLQRRLDALHALERAQQLG